jgi:hypothetical protein
MGTYSEGGTISVFGGRLHAEQPFVAAGRSLDGVERAMTLIVAETMVEQLKFVGGLLHT